MAVTSVMLKSTIPDIKNTETTTTIEKVLDEIEKEVDIYEAEESIIHNLENYETTEVESITHNLRPKKICYECKKNICPHTPSLSYNILNNKFKTCHRCKKMFHFGCLLNIYKNKINKINITTTTTTKIYLWFCQYCKLKIYKTNYKLYSKRKRYIIEHNNDFNNINNENKKKLKKKKKKIKNNNHMLSSLIMIDYVKGRLNAEKEKLEPNWLFHSYGTISHHDINQRPHIYSSTTLDTHTLDHTRQLSLALYTMDTSTNPSGCARTEGFKKACTSVKTRRIERQLLKTKHKCLTSSSSTDDGLGLGNPPILSKIEEDLIRWKYLQWTCEGNRNLRIEKSSIDSWGLYTYESINKDEVICEYTGELIRSSLADHRERIRQKIEADGKPLLGVYGDYMFRIDDHIIIDASYKGSVARYINHSCEPNCIARKISISGKDITILNEGAGRIILQPIPLKEIINKIVIFSSRYINLGEELSYDYLFPIEPEHLKIPCFCGAAFCRQTMN